MIIYKKRLHIFLECYQEKISQLELDVKQAGGSTENLRLIYNFFTFLCDYMCYISSYSAPVAAFSAYRSSDTQVAGGAIVIWDSERFDVSNSYDTSTGVFTCPQDGYYFFSITVYTPSSGDQVCIVNFALYTCTNKPVFSK